VSEADPGAAPGAGTGGTGTRPRRINDGPGRVLLVVYVVFAISAGARAVFQIATQFSDAPVAFGLSAFSAVVYLVAAVAIGRGRRGPALVAVWIELVGVLAVGLFSVLAAQDFPRSTVWSDFGAGYGFVPVILPILGLLWLRRHRPATR
jgi:hypothetical protein